MIYPIGCYEAALMRRATLDNRRPRSTILILAEPVVEVVVVIITSATATQVKIKSPGCKRSLLHTRIFRD